MVLWLVTLAMTFISQCKYKDNTYPSLIPAKKRLAKVWHLKKAIVVSTGYNILEFNPNLYNETLKISLSSNNLIILDVNNSPLTCTLSDKNRSITEGFGEGIVQGDSQSMAIHKLTSYELQMQGTLIAGMCGGLYFGSDKVQLTYETNSD